MRYVFGPVFSRRLGQSLGVDPIPQKTCNWNCVYCQLGRTTPMTDQITEWAPAEEIVAAAERRGARAVALSIVFPADDARLYDELRRLRRLLPDRVTILAGGRASSGLDRIVPEIRLVDDLSTLLDALEELRRSA